ncbi:MAG: hypothetical protein ABIT83_19040 [Massilia sp.]
MRLLTLLLTLGCVACGSPSPGSSAGPGPAPVAANTLAAASASAPAAANTPAPAVAPADTLGQIKAMVGAARCTESSQCRSLALGARACGGPQSYIAWSSATTAEAPLRALADRYQREQQAANQASGAISTCQFMVDPGAVCQAHVCRPGSGAAAGPAAQ